MGKARIEGSAELRFKQEARPAFAEDCKQRAKDAVICNNAKIDSLEPGKNLAD